MSLRDWFQMAEDKVLALGNYGWGDTWDRGPKSKRAKTVQEICSELPDDLYQRFKERMKDRVWFTPNPQLGGTSKNLRASKMIFLSAIWEAAPDELVKYVVVHEMLHVILDHRLNLNGYDPAERDIDIQQEKQVDEVIVALGLTNRRAEASEFITKSNERLGIN